MDGGTRRGSLKRERDPKYNRRCSYSPVEALLSMIGLNVSVFKLSNRDIFTVLDLKYGYELGVLCINDKCYEVFYSRTCSRVIVADKKTHEMRDYVPYRRPKRLNCEGIIDLDVHGRRWEGGVRYGKPYGYGELFDEEGRKEYKGFMINGAKCCYGIEYYSDMNKIRYEGCYGCGQRVGKGVLYDRNGRMEYDGLWKNDAPYSSEFDGRILDNHTESIEVSSNQYERAQSFFPLHILHSLKRLVIGDECFGGVRIFELDGLSELESVVIGRDSFTCAKMDDDIRHTKRTDGACRIVNCLKLKSIQIGSGSFSDYHSFELINLPSLQSIDIGHWCFYWTPSFSLTGLID